MKKILLKIATVLFAVVLLGALFHLRAQKNLDLRNQFPDHRSNFFTFWLSGRMTLNGENPYDEKQYLAGHDFYGVTWKPNKIFPYPISLSLFMIPLGALPLFKSYYVWQIVSQIIVALTVFILLDRWKEPAQSRLLIPLMIFFLFFAPIYLTLQIGSIGALTLLFILISLLLFEKGKSLPAGIFLSLTMLKPPQGIPILLLAGVWLLARQDWKALQGIICGGLGILIVGMMQDPLWIFKFREASQAVMERTLGVHSNVWAYSYLICRGTSPCSALLGGGSALTLLGLCGFYLWKNRARLSAWQAFNIIIPVGFVSTVYLWGYDQILYVIPIAWIVGALVEKYKSYIQAFTFLIVIEAVSFAALTLQTYTSNDLWNIGTTLVIIGMVLWLNYFPHTQQRV